MYAKPMSTDVYLQVTAVFVCATGKGTSEVSRVCLRIATLLKQVDLVQKHRVAGGKIDMHRL